MASLGMPMIHQNGAYISDVINIKHIFLNEKYNW